MEIDAISLYEPECGEREIQLVTAVLESARWGDGPMLESFERAFAGWAGRRHAVAVGSGTLGTWIALRAYGIGPGDEVVCSSHSWHQVAQAITLAGATPVFADINYWTGCLSPEKAALKITPQTRAILAGNTNGHPADWDPLRALAKAHGYDHVIDYRSEDFVAKVMEITQGAGVPAVYDSVGADTVMRSLDVLQRFGTLVSFGQSSGPSKEFTINDLTRGSLRVTRPTLFHHTAREGWLAQASSAMFDLIASGAIKVTLSKPYALEAVGDAHVALEGRATMGSTVLIP